MDELEDHISQLHEYNDIKDVGQMLLGKLGERRDSGANRLRRVPTPRRWLDFPPGLLFFFFLLKFLLID